MVEPEPPKIKVCEYIAIAFDCVTHVEGHAPIRVHIEQDGPCVASQAIEPIYDAGIGDDFKPVSRRVA